jgi:hypothetical protein
MRFVSGMAAGVALGKLVKQQDECEKYLRGLDDLPPSPVTTELRLRALAEKQQLDRLFFFVTSSPSENTLIS